MENNIEIKGSQGTLLNQTITAEFNDITYEKIISEQTTKKSQPQTRSDNPWTMNPSENNEWAPIINAVDIDWNDAQIQTSSYSNETTTINTTGELLSIIQHNSPMFAKVA